MPKDNTLLTYGRYGALGFEFAGAVLAGIFLGRYLDEICETTPLLMILGAVGGMAGALYRLVVVLQHMSHQKQSEYDDRKDGSWREAGRTVRILRRNERLEDGRGEN